MATIRDNRPRNPEHIRRINELFNPEILRPDLGFYNIQEMPDRSIDNNLDDTGDFLAWANGKRKGTNLDPENRRPIQISDSTVSNFDIEFTRLNKTDNQISSMSSLSIPITSNGSLSMLECSTPRSPIPNRKSGTSKRQSGPLTPTLILRQRHSTFINGLTASQQLKRSKQSLGGFRPTNCSTPVRSGDRFKSISFQEFQSRCREPQSIADAPGNEKSSVASDRTIENANTSNNLDESEKTLTNSNKGSESASATIVPETQDPEKTDANIPATQDAEKNDSTIPETQDAQENGSIIPETQDNQIPDTQNDYVPENTQDKSYIPETQEDNTQITQNNVATDPVQAQVSNEKTKQQAEPQNVSNISTRSRILSRPPIRNLSQNVTPAKYVPLNEATASKTPSRIPRIASTITKITPKPAAPIVNDKNTTKVGELNVTNASNAAGRTVVVVASPKPTQPYQSPAAAPPTVVPAPNMTINVNVNSSMPQSPNQPTHTNNTNGQIVNNSRKNVTRATKSQSLSTNNNSLMTNDSEASEDGNGLSGTNQLETPRGKNDSNDISAKRQLFPSQLDLEPGRRSATFDKIENLTQTIRRGDSIASTAGTSQTQMQSTIQSTLHGMSTKRTGTPRSQTFVKSKTATPQNATYDILKDKTPCHQQYDPIDSAEFIQSFDQRDNDQDSNINMANFPSEAILSELMDVSEDAHDANQIEDQIANGSSDRSDNNLSLSRHESRSNDKKRTSTTSKSSDQSQINSMFPVVLLTRVDEPNSSVRSAMNATNIFRDMRESQMYTLEPPTEFQNSRHSNRVQDQEIIDEFEASPATYRRKLSELEETAQSNVSPRKRSKRRSSKKKDEAAAKIEESLMKLKKKKSEEGKARRLTSVEKLHPNQTFDEDDLNEIQRASTSTSVSPFKVPDVPNATSAKSRKSKSKTTRRSKANADLSHTDELAVEVNIAPIFDDEPDAHNITNSTESNMPTQGSSPVVTREPSPVPETQRRSRSTTVKSKAASKAINKAKESEVVNEVDEEDDATDANHNQSVSRRSDASTSKSKPKSTKPPTKKTTKSKKNSKADSEVVQDVELNTATEQTHSGRPKRTPAVSTYIKHRQTLLYRPVHVTAKRPIKSAPAVDNNVNEPPQKKRKSNDIQKSSVRSTKSSFGSNDGRKSGRPTTSSYQSMSKPGKSSTTSISEATPEGSNLSTRISFVGGNREEKRLEKSKFWNEFIDISKKNHVTHEDAIHFNCGDGTIETTYTDQIQFSEIDGVDYGLMASKDYHVGFMRFPPGSKKNKGKSSFELELCIIRGTFKVSSGDDEEAEVFAPTEILIKKDAYYEIINTGQIEGLIQFAYVSSF